LPEDDGRDIVIVSDLHLSAGYDPRTGTFDPLEDFFYDGAFSRFVDHLLTRPRPQRLVVLGDFMEFLQVEPDDEELEIGDTSEAAAVSKLEAIERGHPLVFEALGRFVSAGNPVDVLPGNHDIEFCWPGVQRKLRELVAPHVEGKDVEDMISFHPWFFYVPDVLYAEHGHQYDANNSFTRQINPVLERDPEKLELPLGSFFVLYWFNYIEQSDPFADNVKPATRYLSWVLLNHPVRAMIALRHYPRFLIKTLRKSGDLDRHELRRIRDDYRQEFVRPYARKVGLPERALENLDRIAKDPSISSRELLYRNLLRMNLPVLSAPVVGPAVYHLLKSYPERRPVLGFLLITALMFWRDRALIREGWRNFLRAGRSPDYLRQASEEFDEHGFLFNAALRIHACLRQAGHSVPVYVMGHTHEAEQHPLEEDSFPRYINSGTWTPILSNTFDLLGERERLTFVEITRGEGGSIESHLMVWNDDAGRADPFLDIGQ
jgi:UDP-2,3-diacylglucosamine pyrophosphatase LpxH